MKKLRKELENPVIDAKRNEIEKLKSNINKSNNKEFEIRDGRIVVHRRYKILKNLDDNTIVIGARNKPNIDYQRSYRNEKGLLLNENNRVIIKRRNPHIKVNGLFKISKSKYNIKELAMIPEEG